MVEQLSSPMVTSSTDPGGPEGGGGVPRRAVLQLGAVAGAALAVSGLPAGRASAATVEGAAAASVQILPTVSADGSGTTPYTQHRAPLRAAPFLPLPPGAVRAGGWLRQQLDLQLDGMNGRYDEVSDYLDYDSCGWVHPAKAGWEELPYWLRGFGDLGYVTGDAGVLERTEKWITGIMATQTSDGWFGPTSLRTSLEGGPDFWPGMPLLAALRSWHEYSGDDAVPDLMEKFFRFQSTQPDAVFGRSWAAQRWGDNIDSIYWLYDRTGDSWLLDLVDKIHAGMADYVSGMPNWHNVNVSQGFREPLQYWLRSGQDRHHDATYARYAQIMGGFGQFPGGGFAGDENVRQGYSDPRQGFETCGIVELMHSHEMLARMTGDPAWADRCEDLAINSLPAAFDPQQRAIHYVTSANSTRLRSAAQTMGQFDNTWAMQSYMTGVHNYRCCPHNYGMGWPYYVEESWLASHDGGLVASLYAPTTVEAKVASGQSVTIEERTSYPFDETVELRVGTSKDVAFPLYLRIPAWAGSPSITVAGRRVRVTGSGAGYVRLDRTWHDGDVVTLRLPMSTSVREWPDNQDSVSVQHGPVTFSLAIGELSTRYDGSEQWPELTADPTSPWNYGLDLPSRHPEREIKVRRRSVPSGANPFVPATTPLVATAPARLVPGWREDADDVVGVLQPGPARTTASRTTVDLVPLGAARLRISSFPRVSTDRSAHAWAAPTASWCFGSDDVNAIGLGDEPSSSLGENLARHSFWPHVGTSEWVQYDFGQQVEARAVELYWFDDTGDGQCRVPASWQLFSRQDDAWVPVSGASGYGTARSRFNRVSFRAVRTDALRIQLQLQPGVSGGVLRWRYDAR
ncbi:beta-L-arabinofuranosidase domain-containing protein [Luteimicrobium sp. DT211]|uniref:beta-L-arabinofuranosidase domain-containing protein n=1 Tax=Luteimicrobium sp. DT211 TaxID=3393412 RepID=UPI003CF5B369